VRERPSPKACKKKAYILSTIESSQPVHSIMEAAANRLMSNDSVNSDAKEVWDLADRVCAGRKITYDEALSLSALPDESTTVVLVAADRIRRRFKGMRVTGCFVVNAKSGRCSENCTFCAQSIHNKASVESYGMLSADELTAAFNRAAQYSGAACGIVTSGRNLNRSVEIETVCETVRRAVAAVPSVRPHASLGALPVETLALLKNAGLHGYHHNLETSATYFPQICTTHTYDERMATVRAAKDAGLWVCSGGLFGLGETWDDRAELAFTLSDLDVDSVPVNFLNPVPGTKLEKMPRLEPLECLRIIALMRFVLPQADIRVCGGREQALRDLQSMMFFAGANGTMFGDYLTTTGRPVQDDVQLIRDLGMELSSVQ